GYRGVACLLRGEGQGADQRRDAVALVEREGHDARIAFGHGEIRIARIVVLLVDEIGWRIDFGERAEEAELLAVLEIPPAPPVFAPGPDVHVAHRHVPAPVALPPAHEVGAGVRIPHELSRRMEGTG